MDAHFPEWEGGEGLAEGRKEVCRTHVDQDLARPSQEEGNTAGAVKELLSWGSNSSQQNGVLIISESYRLGSNSQVATSFWGGPSKLLVLVDIGFSSLRPDCPAPT